MASRGEVPTRLSWLAEKPNDFGAAVNDTIVLSGLLTPSAKLLFSDHVVAGNILFPGVGYLEVAFAANIGRGSVLTSVAFLRPCILPEPRSGKTT